MKMITVVQKWERRFIINSFSLLSKRYIERERRDRKMKKRQRRNIEKEER
jgi:hypothetical protein